MSPVRFIKFCCVGVAGFAVDAGIVTGLTALGLDPFLGRLISFLCGMTTTWFLNRVFTFADHDEKWLSQWLRFASVNSIGGLINYAVYAAAVALVPFFRDHLVLAVALGSVAGLAWNFTGSSKLVFHRRRPD